MVDCEVYVDNCYSKKIISQKLYDICSIKSDIVFVFIGTDANIGDSLGPICGNLTGFSGSNCLFYGDLTNTITAKDVPYLVNFIKNSHPSSFIVTVDAALGDVTDIGTIKICQRGIKPGLGVNKDLPAVGDAAIISVVGEKKPDGTLNTVLRLGAVYKIAKTISDGIAGYLNLKSASGDYMAFNKKL